MAQNIKKCGCLSHKSVIVYSYIKYNCLYRAIHQRFLYKNDKIIGNTLTFYGIRYYRSKNHRKNVINDRLLLVTLLPTKKAVAVCKIKIKK